MQEFDITNLGVVQELIMFVDVAVAVVLLVEVVLILLVNYSSANFYSSQHDCENHATSSLHFQ